MKKWSEKSLAAEGYKLMNAEITCVSLNFRDHGVLTLDLSLSGGGWGCVYGGYVLGKGYLGAREFKGSASGLEAIMRIMDIVGVEDLIALWKHMSLQKARRASQKNSRSHQFQVQNRTQADSWICRQLWMTNFRLIKEW